MINDEDCMMDANSIASDDSGSDGDEGNASDDDLGIAMADTDLQDQNKRESDEFHQEVLTQDEIVRHMCDIIREVTNVIQIPATTARILLNHFKWDREKLMEAYYENSDPEKLFRDVHIVSPFRKSSTSSTTSGGGGTGSASSSQPSCSTAAKTVAAAYSSFNTGSTVTGGSVAGGTGTRTGASGPVTRSRLQNALQSVQQQQPQQQHPPQPAVIATPASAREETCHICFTPCLQEAMTGLQCEHKFCSMCWTLYLTTKIMDEGMGQTISCAAYNCDILVDDATVMRLVSDKKVRFRYQHLITNSFVECNRLLRWCPSPDCSNAIKVQYADSRPVTCKCGFTFCFTCGHEWHDPVKCSILKKWIKKCSDDSETSNWIAANTKECPKCHVTIEKDGGCNHMTCKSQTCKWEFCWVCLGPWEPHGSTWYSCNRFDDANAKAARDAQERSRAALQRYLHYCNRYMNHMQSLKFENKLYASAKTKMEQMQQHNMSWIEVQFLRKAINILCQCRRTLMYTYVFAYYLTKNNQSIIFEDNQQDLEIATEQLSEFLERDLEKENLATLKQKVQDKYRYCENRRKVLMDHCHEGDEKDWWIFTD